MATKLEKNITRESSVQIDERNVVVTMTADQKIQFKLKGMKTGMVEIDIKELFCQLADCDNPANDDTPKPVSIKHGGSKNTKDNPMIPLSDLRSKSAISNLDYETKAKFDGIIRSLIEEMKWNPKQFKNKK